MPLPIILGGLGIAAGIIGAGAHLSAKEKNELAETTLRKAKSLYNDTKLSLEEAQKNTEDALLNFGYQKKEILENSLKQFLISYERINHFELKQSVGINEISNFSLEQQDAIQLREMINIYDSAFSSCVTGAATGAVIALAASGSLPVVTGIMSTAGTAFIAGEIGAAAGLAGSALSFGASMTPLAAIAAPVILFTGISSSIKADENLEKAKTTYAEVEVAVEKMETSKCICEAIINRANMFNEVLNELNVMFSGCTKLLDGVTRNKLGIFKNKKIKSNKFTESEIKLIAVTRALAGTIKAIIDTPIIGEDGNVYEESNDIYENAQKDIISIGQIVKELEQAKFDAKPIELKQKTIKKDAKKVIYLKDFLRNTFAIILALILSNVVKNTTFNSYFTGITVFTFVLLALMNTNTEIKIFNFIKKIAYFCLSMIFCVLFFKYAKPIVNTKLFLLYDIIAFIITTIVLSLLISYKLPYFKNLNKLGKQVAICTIFFEIGILGFAFLYKLIHLSFGISMTITLIIYALFVLVSVYEIEDL